MKLHSLLKFLVAGVGILMVVTAPRAAEKVATARMVADATYLAPDRAEKLDLYLPTPPA
jgi:hypothetical protein